MVKVVERRVVVTFEKVALANITFYCRGETRIDKERASLVENSRGSQICLKNYVWRFNNTSDCASSIVPQEFVNETVNMNPIDLLVIHRNHDRARRKCAGCKGGIANAI